MINSDIILDMTGKIDKNSTEFDNALLSEMVGVTFCTSSIKKLIAEVRKYMRRKSSCKLWFEFRDTEKWDGKEYKKCNFICCPASKKANPYFCLTIQGTQDGFKIADGFLSAV